MYRGKIVSDWGMFEQMGGIENPTARNMVRGALNHFLAEPTSPPFRAAAQAFANTGDVSKAQSVFQNACIQAFGTSGDFPASVLEVLDKYHQTLYFDIGYEQIFKILPMENSKRNSFDILDVTSDLVFSMVPEGLKAKIFKMSGEKTTVSMDMYGAGLGWSRRLFDDEEYWNIEDNAIQFRNKAYESKALNHYALLEAAPATYDLAWQAVTGAVPNTNENYVPIRDINTINKACENILIRLQDLGMGVTPASEFIILAPIQLIGRIRRALGMVQQPFAGSTTQLNYNVRPVYTLMLVDTTVFYVIFPKNKIEGGNRMNLTVFSDFDIEAYTDIAVGWMRYGAAIAETKQIVRCSTS
uniref:Capsid protein n=1 Tax=viral metagenome TaxID=1070528 RepID=A0A6M3L180_9ZZZZ